MAAGQQMIDMLPDDVSAEGDAGEDDLEDVSARRLGRRRHDQRPAGVRVQMPRV